MDPYKISLHEIQREKQRANERIMEAIKDFQDATGLRAIGMEYVTTEIKTGEIVMGFKTIIVRI